MISLRSLGAASALITVLAFPAVGQSVDSLSTTQGTTGLTFDITGEGFGAAKPKVELQTDGKKAKGSLLKVLEWTDTTATVEIKKAAAGTYDLVLRPKGKGIEPAVAAQPFTIETISGLTPEVTAGDPGEEVIVTASFMGSKKAKVKVGGKKAAVKQWVPLASEGLDPAGFFSILLPKKLPNGSYTIEVVTKVGTVTVPEFIDIENSDIGLPKPGKASFTAKVGGKSFKGISQTLLWTAFSIGESTATNWTATHPGGNPRVFMFSVQYNPEVGGAASLSGSQLIAVSYSEGFFPNTTSYTPGNGFVVNIEGVVGDQIIGNFSGPMNKLTGEGAASIQVTDGKFVLNKAQ